MLNIIQRKLFLKEYVTLCKKYNLCINACDCCDSPWIQGMNFYFDKDNFKEHIKHLEATLESDGVCKGA